MGGLAISHIPPKGWRRGRARMRTEPKGNPPNMGRLAPNAEAEQSKMWVSLKVDQDTKMGIVTNVKQELRQASALKVLYSASSRSRTGAEE